MNSPRRDRPSEDLRARILAEVAKTPAPTRRVHTSRALGVLVVGALGTAALFGLSGGFEKGARPLSLVVFTAGIFCIAATILTGVSYGRSRSMLGRPRRVLVVACAAALPLLVAIALGVSLLWSDPLADVVRTRMHVGCGLLTAVDGLAPLLALALLRRESDPVHPALTGAALGAAAGGWTATLAYLRCPHVEATHCIVAHVLPTLVLIAAGALLGRALLGIRVR